MSTDSMDKIRLKGGPKQYKRGPAPIGRARLEQRLAKLTIDLSRFTRRTSSDDLRWAQEWLAVIQAARERIQR